MSLNSPKLLLSQRNTFQKHVIAFKLSNKSQKFSDTLETIKRLLAFVLTIKKVQKTFLTIQRQEVGFWLQFDIFDNPRQHSSGVNITKTL